MRIYLGSKPVTLTHRDTVVHLFKNSDDLDHAEVKLAPNRSALIYDKALLVKLIDEDFPVNYRAGRPEWAINRYLAFHCKPGKVDAAIERMLRP